MLYSGTEGYVVLATMNQEMEDFHERFFQWPNEMEEFLTAIDEAMADSKNVYYCPQVFSERKRLKKTVAYATCAWADLDECNPEDLLVAPTFVIQSSKQNYQALWMFDRGMEPSQAENISRRIAAHHRFQGADHCWNLGRILRVPYTNNYKYTPAYQVKIADTHGGRFRPAEFDVYPQVQGNEYLDIPFPEELPDITAIQLLEEKRPYLGDRILELWEKAPAPGESWSHPLWSLLMLLFEAGLTREETYIVATEAACNKFKRDGKSKEALWADVCRAYFRAEFNTTVLTQKKDQPDAPLLTDEERSRAEESDTFVERYIKWASTLGDAATQYHQAGAFVCLSSLLAGSVKLPTSFGTVIPNLWFMILADTTLTRKSTSMDIPMEMLSDEVDPDVLLATDGSLEGLFTALSTRPGKPSVFLRDEFSGLLDAMNKKDYMAGMPEMLTKLYDGKVQKRILRKEVVTVKDPVLILYTGGIRSKVQEILTLEQVASGFLPRFVFITAESDINRIQPIGPPTQKNWGARSKLVEELRTIQAAYSGTEHQKLNGHLINTNAKRVWTAELTPQAWTRYNVVENNMMRSGVKSNKPEVYTPLYDRLSKSILKAAVLIAASRQLGAERVIVEESDIVHALYYGEQWKGYAKEIIVNVGHSRNEKQLQTIYGAIVRSAGMSRSALMQAYHLSSRDANVIFDTLEQRGMISRARVGKTEMLHPLLAS